MTTSAGVPVQSVFGFIRMMQQMHRRLYPTHVAVAFDGGVPQCRLDLVPAYKAQRKPMPDALRVQLPITQEYLSSAGIPFFCLQAIEADDVMATFAKAFNGQVFIATSDKDMYQLVSDKISIVPLSGDMNVLGPKEILQKTGVLPSQIVDWLALTGDSADNISGVPGVGPKTASALLSAFGDIDTLYARLEDVKRKGIRKALEEHASIVWRNREMVSLHHIVDLPDVATLRYQSSPVANLQAFYDEYEFTAFSAALRSPELF